MVEPVQVWLVDADHPVGSTASLDAVEQQRAAAFQQPADRRRFTATHVAVRQILGDVLGVAPASLAWRFGAHGKPYLTDGVQFSWSHSGSWAMLAVHPSVAVGIDIQELLPQRSAERLARRYFRIDTVDPASFARLWSRNEAAVKAAGARLLDNLGVPTAGCEVRDVTAPTGYHAAVALRPAPPHPFELVEHRWHSPDR
jgi:4'-phosphopantetheinyl transferase